MISAVACSICVFAIASAPPATPRARANIMDKLAHNHEVLANFHDCQPHLLRVVWRHFNHVKSCGAMCLPVLVLKTLEDHDSPSLPKLRMAQDEAVESDDRKEPEWHKHQTEPDCHGSKHAPVDDQEGQLRLSVIEDVFAEPVQLLPDGYYDRDLEEDEVEVSGVRDRKRFKLFPVVGVVLNRGHQGKHAQRNGNFIVQDGQ